MNMGILECITGQFFLMKMLDFDHSNFSQVIEAKRFDTCKT